MPESAKPLRIFLSYAHADLIAVRKLHKYLREKGFDVWFDKESLLPGQDWQLEIEKGLGNSDVVIICLSQTAVSKEGFVQREFKFALDRTLEIPDGRIFLIPVRLQVCEVPTRLSRYHWVDLFERDGYSRLMRSLKMRAEQLARANVEETQPVNIPEPDENLGGSVSIGQDVSGNVILGNNNVINITPAPTAQDEAAKREKQKEEDERQAWEKAEAEEKIKEQERLAAEEAEKERLEKIRAENERIAKDKAEKVRLAQEKLEAERIAQEQIEQERVTSENAEKERLAKLKIENERLALEKTEQERLAHQKTESESKVQPKTASKRGNATPQTSSKMTGLFFGGLLFLSLCCLTTTILLLGQIPVKPTPTLTPKASATKAPQATSTYQRTKTTLLVTITPEPPTEIPFTPTSSSTYPVAGATMISPKDNMILHYVPAGEFIMGNTIDNAQAECQKRYTDGCDAAWFEDEAPPHKVNLDAFWIDETEITNKLYNLCVVAGACVLPSDKKSSTHLNYYDDLYYKDYPVIYINWNDAQEYCTWVGRSLPSEAQWEKAARGTDGRIYPWGNDTPSRDFSNYNINIGDTTKVGTHIAGKSAYGVLDMAGNVSEWVNDWYEETYYSFSPPLNPLGPNAGKYRVNRGGSWTDGPDNMRATNRGQSVATESFFNVGFRCVLSQ